MSNTYLELMKSGFCLIFVVVGQKDQSAKVRAETHSYSPLEGSPDEVGEGCFNDHPPFGSN